MINNPKEFKHNYINVLFILLYILFIYRSLVFMKPHSQYGRDSVICWHEFMDYEPDPSRGRPASSEYSEFLVLARNIFIEFEIIPKQLHIWRTRFHFSSFAFDVIVARNYSQFLIVSSSSSRSFIVHSIRCMLERAGFSDVVCYLSLWITVAHWGG